MDNRKAYEIYMSLAEGSMILVHDMYCNTAMHRDVAKQLRKASNVRMVVKSSIVVNGTERYGAYDIVNNTIYIKPGLNEGLFNDVMEHEIIHAGDVCEGLINEDVLERRTSGFRDNRCLRIR